MPAPPPETPLAQLFRRLAGAAEAHAHAARAVALALDRLGPDLAGPPRRPATADDGPDVLPLPRRGG